MKTVDDKCENQRNITSVISKVASAVVGKFEINSLLNQIIKTTMNLLHAEVCSIFLEDRVKNPGVLECVAGSGFAKGIVNKAKYKIGEGFTGTVARTGGVYNIKNRSELENLVVDGKKAWGGHYDKLQWPSKESEFRNLLAAPLKIQENIFGVLKAENKDINFGEYFSSEDAIAFETIANVIALTIENARLHGHIKDQAKTFTLLTAHKIFNHIVIYDGIKKHLDKACQKEIPEKHTIIDQSEKIKKATLDLKRKVNELSYYGQPIELKLELADINQIIKDEVWLSKPPQYIEIKQELDESNSEFYFDPVRISDVIKELINNSIRAINKENRNGRIIVRTLYMKDNKTINDSIKITIEDNGPGIDNISQAFAPYYTTGHRGGMGLGLATVKDSVEAHKGTIEYVKKDGCGACFEILIPTRREK